MDLGVFADEVLDTVAGICGDSVVETHEQAGHVLDSLARRPGANAREMAAVFGVSLEQFERCRSRDWEKNDDKKAAVWTNICRSDAIFTWNVLIQRINAAAHWKEEFRDMQNEGDHSSDEEDEEQAVVAQDGQLEVAIPQAVVAQDGQLDVAIPDANALAMEVAGEASRAKCRELLERQLDCASAALGRRLARRLEAEIFEHCPGKKDFTHAARCVVANLRRNTMLAGGYAIGRVPPEWIILADHEALAPRMRQLQRRVFRAECKKEVRMAEDEEKIRSRMWRTAKGTDLAPPAQNDLD
eukprot:TRINITY_DN11377_c0_g1_i1.p1 TRINITY_DN11377_c0_g1~~TRINITY_DN11377_c0_g1_i1.p1  ORF type:complete len:319 (-),score=69.08 TRINITY_DN11377_c0_g1_i1:89-985(-)